MKEGEGSSQSTARSLAVPGSQSDACRMLCNDGRVLVFLYLRLVF